MEAKRTPPCRIMLTGDYHHADFAAVRAFLSTASGVGVSEAPWIDRAAEESDLIALCQSRPGQFSQEEVESLHARAPLARLLAILGSWCEGELRSGRPWHGVDRVYWCEAIGRLAWLLVSPRPAPAWRTYAAAERIERSVSQLRAASAGGAAAIATQRRSEYEPLADLCRALAIAPRWVRDWQGTGAAPELLLVAADDMQAGVELESLVALCNAWPGARRIALLNFPRRNEVARLREAGFQHVLGKPLLVVDLLGCLGDLWIGSEPQKMAAS